MSTALERLFTDQSQCIAELAYIRDMYGSASQFTPTNIIAALKLLSIMGIYCPVDFRHAVTTHIREIQMRWEYIKDNPRRR